MFYLMSKLLDKKYNSVKHSYGLNQWFSKCGPRTLGVPETLSGDPLSQYFFPNNNKLLFAFILILSV